MSEAVRRALTSAVLVSGLALAGCGGDEDGPDSPTLPAPGGRPTATTPRGTTPTAPARSAAGKAPVAGGSQRARVPATFTLRGGTLTPRTVSIPPFLAIEVSVADTGGGGPQTVVIEAERRFTLRLPAGGRASLTLPGQPPGRYPVTAGRARALLIVGGEPGP